MSDDKRWKPLFNLDDVPSVLETSSFAQPQGTEARVCHDISERQAKGIAKYGKTVEQNYLPLKDWLQHAYEECLDQAIYLKRAIEEIDNEGIPSE